MLDISFHSYTLVNLTVSLIALEFVNNPLGNNVLSYKAPHRYMTNSIISVLFVILTFRVCSNNIRTFNVFSIVNVNYEEIQTRDKNSYLIFLFRLK